MKNEKIRIAAVSVLIVLTLCYIWYNSMESVERSSARSSELVEFLEPILEPVVGEGNVTEHFIRKSAHFCEFCLLGAELRLLFLLLRFRLLQGHANALFVALCAAVADESIQFFFKRGSQVLDVVLDFSGSFFGALVVLLIALAVRKRKEKRRPLPVN